MTKFLNSLMFVFLILSCVVLPVGMIQLISCMYAGTVYSIVGWGSITGVWMQFSELLSLIFMWSISLLSLVNYLPGAEI